MFLSECTVGIYLLYSTCKQPVLRDHLLPLAIRFQFHMRHIPASWARTVHWGMANRDWQNRYVLYLNFKRHVWDTDPSSSVLVEFSYIYIYTRLTILRFADSEIVIGQWVEYPNQLLLTTFSILYHVHLCLYDLYEWYHQDSRLSLYSLLGRSCTKPCARGDFRGTSPDALAIATAQRRCRIARERFRDKQLGMWGVKEVMNIK